MNQKEIPLNMHVTIQKYVKRTSPRALFVFAHPDDESYATGGLILQLKKLGWRISLVCATAGQNGQVGRPPVTTPERLGEVRKRELRDAVQVLGIDDIIIFPYIDRHLKKIDHKVLSDKVFWYMEKEKPEIVVSFDETGLYGHSDHIAIYYATTRAVRLYRDMYKHDVFELYVTFPQKLSTQIKGFYVGGSTPVVHVLDVSGEYEQKLEAITCHKSQHQTLERMVGYNRPELFLSEYYIIKEERMERGRF